MYTNIYAETDEEFNESLIYYGTSYFELELIDFKSYKGTLFDLEMMRAFILESGHFSLVYASDNIISYNTTYCKETDLTIYLPLASAQASHYS